MKEVHKNLIEDIISEFKKNENGKMYKDVLAVLIKDSELRDLISNFLVKDLNFVDDIDSQIFRLNSNGWSFVSFKDIESKALSEELKVNLEIELAKSNLEANKLNKEIAKRNSESEKFNKRISIFNFIFVILNFFILIWQIIKSVNYVF